MSGSIFHKQKGSQCKFSEFTELNSVKGETIGEMVGQGQILRALLAVVRTQTFIWSEMEHH